MPRRWAATREPSLSLTLLQPAQRAILDSVDGWRAAPLEGVEQGGGQELVPEPNQVLERRAARLRRHDFREPPPTRLALQQLLDDALSSFWLRRVNEQHAVEPILFLIARSRHHVGLQAGGAVRDLLELVGRKGREQIRISHRQRGRGAPTRAQQPPGRPPP